MTDQLFFDTDCISSFLWVKQENLILQLYPGRIILPQDVYNELLYPFIPHIKAKILSLVSSRSISTMQIMTNTEEYEIYHDLAISPLKGRMVIGRGEAAALALAKVNNGIVASNNLKDISQYIAQFHLAHVTTGDILVESLNQGLIDENTGNQIWAKMVQKQRKLPTPAFSAYLQSL